jgi:hypothetical protein
MEIIMTTQKRLKLTREILAAHIEALITSPSKLDKTKPDTMKAALKAGVSYPTFLARFRRAKLKVTDVYDSVVNNNVMPEVIVSQVFKAIDATAKKTKKAKAHNIYSFKELGKLLREATYQVEHAQAS